MGENWWRQALKLSCDDYFFLGMIDLKLGVWQRSFDDAGHHWCILIGTFWGLQCWG